VTVIGVTRTQNLNPRLSTIEPQLLNELWLDYCNTVKVLLQSSRLLLNAGYFSVGQSNKKPSYR